jgi:glucose-6-phosphate-specific signal transduction histidine kinase
VELSSGGHRGVSRDQESLVNIVKHAKASSIMKMAIRMTLKIVVRDNGTYANQTPKRSQASRACVIGSSVWRHLADRLASHGGALMRYRYRWNGSYRQRRR